MSTAAEYLAAEQAMAAIVAPLLRIYDDVLWHSDALAACIEEVTGAAASDAAQLIETAIGDVRRKITADRQMDEHALPPVALWLANGDRE
ncbi:MAG: hypothetical protein MUF47_12575 [Porphyrobacter sp.]|jgi:hypothetical protein|nr:hypothetical protein [Porphyrobacter sp.]